MLEFDDQLKQINEVEYLIEWKEKIKNQIMEPNLDWTARLELYKKVRLLNEKIDTLKHKE